MNDAAARPGRLIWLVGAVAAAVVAIDQVTKTIVLESLERGEPVHVFWTLQLNLSFNTGAAFSIGTGIGGWLVVAGLVLLALLLFVSRRVTSRTGAVALGLLLGGAVGNLSDRIFRDHGGAVVDFIDFQWWPIFNVADIALSCGAILVLIAGWRDQ